MLQKSPCRTESRFGTMLYIENETRNENADLNINFTFLCVIAKTFLTCVRTNCVWRTVETKMNYIIDALYWSGDGIGDHICVVHVLLNNGEWFIIQNEHFANVMLYRRSQTVSTYQSFRPYPERSEFSFFIVLTFSTFHI